MKKPHKITIIGGSGFVGTNLCRYLAERQQEFEILDLKKSAEFPDKSKYADVRDIDSLRAEISGNVVVNLAAVHRDDVREKAEYFSTNVDGAENVALVCEELGINKIVFTSSVAVYGHAKAGTDESGEIAPFNEYGRTKFLAEEKFKSWRVRNDSHLVIVRPTVIFGEGNRGNVFNLLNQIAAGRFIMVGSGKNKKSMAYIGNVVAFLDCCIQSDEKCVVVNYVDGPDMDMNSLVSKVKSELFGKPSVGARVPFWFGLLAGIVFDLVAKLRNRKFPISAIRVKKFVSSSSFQSKKEAIDGFQAPYSLLDGLNRTLESEFINPDPDAEVFFTE